VSVDGESNSLSDAELAAQWMVAVRTPEIDEALRAVYDDAATQINARSPACWASGRCCHFEATGHRLYVTGLEAAFAQHHATKPATSADVRTAFTVGGCPFQAGHLCGQRDARPLGCRIYFCDRSAQAWQHELTEHGLEQIRAIHERFGVPYRYAEWRSLLELIATHTSPKA